MLLSYLAVANIAFVAIFLFASPTAKLIAGDGSGDLGEVTLPELGGPVVVLVLDEFPAATIMRPDGTINNDRFRLRRAGIGEHVVPQRLQPAQLDPSRRAIDPRRAPRPEGTLPTYTDHPRNLFTLFGGDVPVHSYESVTSLCPPDLCAETAPLPLTQALEDASIVYGHRVLPGAPATVCRRSTTRGVRTGPRKTAVPAATTSATPTRAGSGFGADERSPLGQAAVLSERTQAITEEPALHFVHVAVPHRPWVLSPSGNVAPFAPELIRDPTNPRTRSRTGGVPAAQLRSAPPSADRRAARPGPGPAELGADDARRHV